ncbi:MAG: copper homeostasis protein CutC [Deltaproteobacteria bacterium]
MNKKIFEICVFNSRSAINAQLAGADRIELCDNMYEGGTTPGYGLIKVLKDILTIDINVMIRPRGGDFHYNDTEFKIMQEDILKCRDLGVNGVVFGILDRKAYVDTDRVAKLVEISHPLSVTFHRAFDMTVDLPGSLKELINVGVDRILTSGGMNKAIEGKNMIRYLVETAGQEIIIMPGSGINPENIYELSLATGAKEFHMSGKKYEDSFMIYRKPGVRMSGLDMIDDYKIAVSDIDAIRKTIEAIKV